MTWYIKKPHTAIFIGLTGCEKTHLVLDSIENQYNKYFDYIFIICPTLRENNKTFHDKEWIKNDDNVWLVDPKDKLYQRIEKLSQLLRILEVLFIIDDIIANESLDKRRQPLLELSISDPRRVEQGKKSYETRMKRLKEKILEDNQLPILSPSSSTCDPTPSTFSHATRSNDTYIYGVGMLAALAIGACVFFAYNTFRPKNKKQANEKKDQPPKRRHML